MAQPAMIDLATWKIVLDIANAVFTAILAVFVFLLNRHRSESNRLKKEMEEQKKNFDQRLDSQGNRLSRMEETVRCAPSHEDIGKLHGRLDRLSEQVNHQTGELKGISHLVGMIHQFLLNQKKGDA